MKTCRFRGAKPRQITLDNTKDDSTEIESILCQLKPNASYDMTPCYKRDCSLCALRLHGNNCRGISNKNSLQVGVEFCSNQIHQFVNKYEAILNCPAVRIIKFKHIHLSIYILYIVLYDDECYLCFIMSLW